MTVTLLLILAILAILTVVASAAGKCPLWVPVVFLALYALVQQLPTGK